MSALDRLAVRPGLAPMEAKLVDALPPGDDWRFEPKWDGFRCLVFRARDEVELQSKSGKPLGRYFPEIVAAVLALKSRELVLDGELMIPIGEALSFEALQMRLHPAESRVRRLAAETPAQLMLFDCLLVTADESLVGRPLWQRREALERFFASERMSEILLPPYSDDRRQAQSWLDRRGPLSMGSSPSSATAATGQANERC
jgi:ATP-dependent DNA ligase